MRGLVFSFILASIHWTAQGALPPSVEHQTQLPQRPSTSGQLRLGLSNQFLLEEPFDGIETGYGLMGSYEFLLSDHVSIALIVSYRHYPGNRPLNQLGGGVLLRHYIPFLSRNTFRPYLSYGLLLQLSSLSGHLRSSTSHDTRLTAGSDFKISRIPLFLEASYHISRLRFLNIDSLNLDYWEFSTGWRKAF